MRWSTKRKSYNLHRKPPTKMKVSFIAYKIKKSVSRMKNGKSPGMDNLTIV